MLFTREFKAAIREGTVTRTYRCWKRPQARTGGRYTLAPDGVIEVTAMARINAGRIRDSDARRAGFPNRHALLDYLNTRPEAELYQVDFRYLGSGTVRQPERGRLAAADLEALLLRIARMDERAVRPWAMPVLDAIGRCPGVRAADLAAGFPGWDTATFKAQVRKLKALGLTRSLETGYELSPRGRQLLENPVD
jgi:hypothetical protein